MNDGGAPLLRFDFRDGRQMELFRTCLVQRGAEEMETIPLSAVGALRVSFQRDTGRCGWGVALVVAALIVFIVARPLGTFSAAAVVEIGHAGTQAGVARALEAMFRALEALATALPFIAVVLVAGGAALAGLGWRGRTVLTLTVQGGERTYAVRGHDHQLMEFAQLAGERLARPEK